jgi:hypothetical protein
MLREGGASGANYYRLQVGGGKLGQRRAHVSERWSCWTAPTVHSKWFSRHARRAARSRPARRRGLSLFLDDSTGIPGTSYQKYTLLTRESYGVMSASECRFWRSPTMSVRRCLCHADNRPDSLSLQRAQGTVGAHSPPIPKSAQTLPKMLPVADRSSLVLRVEQAEGPYPPSLPRGAARPVGVPPTRPSWCDLGGPS